MIRPNDAITIHRLKKLKSSTILVSKIRKEFVLGSKKKVLFGKYSDIEVAGRLQLSLQ